MQLRFGLICLLQLGLPFHMVLQISYTLLC